MTCVGMQDHKMLLEREKQKQKKHTINKKKSLATSLAADSRQCSISEVSKTKQKKPPTNTNRGHLEPHALEHMATFNFCSPPQLGHFYFWLLDTVLHGTVTVQSKT